MVANMDQTNNSQVQIIRTNHAIVAKTEETNPLTSILAKRTSMCCFKNDQKTLIKKMRGVFVC